MYAGEAVTVLKRCLDAVMDWMRVNKLRLNPDKTEVLLVGGSSAWVNDVQPVLDGVARPLKDQVHILGVLLDPAPSLEVQVASMAQSAFYQLRLICQLQPYLERESLATVTHALVTSCLDYCNALYMGLPLKIVRKLQLVQNRAARLLTGTGRFDHIMPMLNQLHWLPIHFWTQFKVLVLTFKALKALDAPYVPTHTLRSSSEALLQVSLPNEMRRVAIRERAFSVVAPCLYNSLPSEVCLAPSLCSFRHQVKTFLFTQAF
ncbi:uncharacterized protein LOC128340742 [Hemicordylus capensis]|uniref:uncharacterized protein LOC128340742 n=1 Tax=Hemicordylus capensis TaxID=884348 RepID=UPI0023035BB3|nr:uncharacterized protein LOC128340742 [Hemicordylus capensis]